MVSMQSEVRTLLDSRIEACRAKDIDRLMSLYSPGIVYFDCVPPLEGFIGSGSVRRNFLRWFDEYEGPITICDLIRDLDPGRVQGRLILMPANNVHAVIAGQRTSPVFELALN